MIGPDTIGPDTIGSDAIGPDAMGPDTVGPDTTGTASAVVVIGSTPLGVRYRTASPWSRQYRSARLRVRSVDDLGGRARHAARSAHAHPPAKATNWPLAKRLVPS